MWVACCEQFSKFCGGEVIGSHILKVGQVHMPKEPHMKPTEVAERSKTKKTKKTKIGDPIPPPPDKPQQCKLT